MQIGGYKYRAGTIYQTLDDVVTDSLLVMQRIEYEWRLVMKSPSCANKKELVARLKLPWGVGAELEVLDGCSRCTDHVGSSNVMLQNDILTQKSTLFEFDCRLKMIS